MLEGKTVIAVDFDGCITNERDMEEEMTLRNNAKEVLTKWYKKGYILILWTCRAGKALEDAVDFLNKHDMYRLFSAVNKQLPEIYEKYYPNVSPKVGADFYIDDRSMGVKIDWLAFDKMMEEYEKERSYQKMFEWHKDLEPLPDNSKLPEILEMLLAIQYVKEKDYGSSWKSRGEYRGIIPNIDRKYDRIDKMTQDEISGKAKTLDEIEKMLENGEEVDVGESKIDAVADLAVYNLLYLTFMKERYPKLFQIWVDRNVPKYLLKNNDK